MPEPVAASAVRPALRYLTFRVADRLYALPADEVREVIRQPSVARVPQGPKALLGVASLRGAVLPLVDLRALLGQDEGRSDGRARAIVIEGATPLALAVDAIHTLVSVDAERLETEQANIAARPGERLRGAFATDAPEVVARILDLRALLDAAFEARARTTSQGATVAVRHAVARKASAGQRLVIFEVAGREYALPLETVREVVPVPQSFAVAPGAEALVVGVSTLRDELLPLLSLRGLLGFAEGEATGREKVIVAEIGGFAVGLVADRLSAIVEAEAPRIDAAPPIIAARTAGEARIAAVYRGEGGRLVSILAPERLFREEVMQRLREAHGNIRPNRAEAFVSSTARAHRQLLVFRLGDDEFGLPIEAVDEVTRVPEKITRIPRTPSFLCGVVNLRGDILPVVDQRRRFDMPAMAQDASRRLIVTRTQSNRAGLIVDSVSDVLRVAEDAIVPAPALTDDIGRLVQGVASLDDDARLILVLAPDELLTRAERGLLDAFQARAAKALP